MNHDGIRVDQLPELRDPLLIAGFEGWGNALNVATATTSYLIQRLDAQPFARLDSDRFYRYDESRPLVLIKEGELKRLTPPGGEFFFARPASAGRDLVILRAAEPQLHWYALVEGLFSFLGALNVRTVVTLGSMYDHILHSERIISGIVSDRELLARIEALDVIAVNYEGPSAIHSLIHDQAMQKGLESLSLWCHCPYYLQGTTHFGLLSKLTRILCSLGGFELQVQELDTAWNQLSEQIEELIGKNPELQAMVDDLRRVKRRGSWESMKESIRRGDKVIDLTEFLEPK